MIIIIPSLLLFAGCNQKWPTSDNKNPPKTSSGSPLRIEITKNGFTPSILSINIGDEVEFVNTDTVPHWPASAAHPTHTVYPWSSIEKCGTSEQSLIFDACKGLAPGESFRFTFHEKWTWMYHDHLDSKLFGRIIVGEDSRDTVGSSLGTVGGISMTNVSYFPGESKYQGYLAKPIRAGKYPALILIHEWWGLNGNIESLAEDFAKEGYVVLAVDLYGEPATTDQQVAMRMAWGVTANEALAFENLGHALEYLRADPNVDANRMGSVGWCFGWGWAYQMAKNNLGTRASVMYYGRFNPKDDLSMMRSDILGHFGEKDTSITINSLNEFQVKLNTLSGTHIVYIYPNAGHGFANEGWANYDEAAADLAWQRTIRFLGQTVKM